MFLAAIALFVLTHGLASRVGERSGPAAGADSGTEVLGPGARAQFAASAYCKGEVTASGAKVRSGIAAADPNILPVGSIVHLQTDEAAQHHSGVYTILDTGPRVNGREIDLYMWSCHDALAFGRREVAITIVRRGWDPAESTVPASVAPGPSEGDGANHR